MTVLLNSAYHHRTHLVDITVMHCVNSNRESFWSQHTSDNWNYQSMNTTIKLRRKLIF